jgi:hypothetical protein
VTEVEIVKRLAEEVVQGFRLQYSGLTFPSVEPVSALESERWYIASKQTSVDSVGHAFGSDTYIVPAGID